VTWRLMRERRASAGWYRPEDASRAAVRRRLAPRTKLMTHDVAIRCRCGRVHGMVRDVSPGTINRAVCYCHDCRAFLHWLERDDLVDERGGTEIIQTARSRFTIEQGQDQLQCVRLGPKGLHRWYAACCNSPLANTVPRIPFVGVARSVFELPAGDEDAKLGARIMSAHPRAAIGGAPPGARFTLRDALRVTGLLLAWSIRRLGHPTPFFDRSNRPIVEPRVLTEAERQKLRDRPRA